MRTVIFIEGGIIQSVSTDCDSEIMIVDYDVEETFEPDILKIKGSEAFVSLEKKKANKENVNEIFKEYENEKQLKKLKNCFLKPDAI